MSSQYIHYPSVFLLTVGLLGSACSDSPAGSTTTDQTQETVPATYIHPSSTRIIVPGEKLAAGNFERVQEAYTLQRLSPRAYWVEAAVYQSTFVVGEQGVLLIDPLSGGRGSQVLAAIREVTDLPITSLVYSHYHYDHVGDAQIFVDEAAQAEHDLRIIGTSAMAAKAARYGNRIPVPTEILDVPRDQFTFENLTLEVGTPPRGHSEDNSWILIPSEGVLHNVDMVHPGQLEFENFGLAQDVSGYEAALEEIMTLDWQIMNTGHGNIGGRADVQFVLDFMTEMREHTQTLLAETEFAPFVSAELMIYGWFQGHRDAVAATVVERMRPQWGRYPGFNLVALSQARQIYWEYYLH